MSGFLSWWEYMHPYLGKVYVYTPRVRIAYVNYAVMYGLHVC